MIEQTGRDRFRRSRTWCWQPFLAVLASFVLSVIGAAAESKYTLMSADEASQTVKKLVREGVFPRPYVALDGISHWKLPETAVAGWGVKINDHDYVVLAPTEVHSMFVPAWSLPELPVDGELWKFLSVAVLFTTVDLKVVEGAMYVDDGKPVTANPRIKKGGYVWYDGPAGLFLRGQENNTFLLFKKPFAKLPPPYQLSLGGRGILIKVGDNSFELTASNP